MKNVSTIGIAFLGSGFAKSVQAPAFNLIDGVKLIGASSPNTSKTFADKFGMPFHTVNWKELIDREDVDVVCVASPPLLHCDQTLYALKNNKHVICEKPFAMNVHEAEKMTYEAKGRNLITIIDHELRFSPARKFLKNYICQGKLGHLYSISATAHYSSRRDLSKRYGWWFNKSWGGGAWGAIGSHLLDQFDFFVGEISEAATLLHTSIPERLNHEGTFTKVTSDDTAFSIVKFKNGLVGQIGISFVSTENRLDIEIIGEKGSIKIDMNDNIYFAESGKGYNLINFEMNAEDKSIYEKYKNSNISYGPPFAPGFVFLAHAVINAIRQGRTKIEGAVDFEMGIKIQKLLDGSVEKMTGSFQFI